MGALEREVIRTGSPQPAPARQQLRAGPLTLMLEEGALRSLRLGSREILRGLYAAVRDHNWGTIAPRFLTYEVQVWDDAFAVRFEAEHVNADVDFLWQGTITGSSAGEITFVFDGQARRTFRKNRIGFCILHPMELAGAELEVETPAGNVQSVFPFHISPHQPFKDIIAMRYTCAPAQDGEAALRVELRCNGELFEMEDQRNWTDASYKTYCTPLRLPYPVQIATGERITQSITLRLLEYPSTLARQPLTAEEGITLNVSAESSGKLPALGFGWARHQPFSSAEIACMRALQPAYLWTELDLALANWQEVLEHAKEDALLLQAELELSVVCDDAGLELTPLFRVLVEQQIADARLCCFSRASHVTTRAMLEQARSYREAAGLCIELGAGSRANFTELNRAQLPLDLAQLVNYPINPQVHAFDNLSLVETLQAQAVTARNTQRVAAQLPLSIGPITFKPRFNSAATTAQDPVAQERATLDARQMSLFGAGWTIGSLSHLASTGARWLTYYELTGWRGLLEQALVERPAEMFPSVSGALFPLYHIFADLAAYRQGQVLSVESSNVYALAALALRQEKRVLLLLGNLSATRQKVQLHLSGLTHLVGRVLDETNAQEAMYDPERFRARRQVLLPGQSGSVAIELLPYAIMHIEAQIEDN